MHACSVHHGECACVCLRVCSVYDDESFADLRSAPLVEAAQAWAALGNVRALCLVLGAAPSVLGPHLLTLLNCLPETLDPRSYSQLLPRVRQYPSVSIHHER